MKWVFRFLVCAAILAIGGLCFWYAYWPNPTPPHHPTSAQLERQLPPSARFHGTLSDAIDLLRDRSGAKIFVNWRSLHVSGIKRHTAVFADVGQMPLKQALDNVLISGSKPDAKLDWELDHGVIEIGMADVLAWGHQQIHVYDIRDMLHTSPPWPLMISQKSWDQLRLRRWNPYGSTVQEQADFVIKHIKMNIAPGEWTSPSSPTTSSRPYGFIREIRGQLVVTQTPDNHQRIAFLLRRLRLYQWLARNSPIIGLTAIVLALLIRYLHRRLGLPARRRRRGLCMGCGYDLRASSGRCPECGKPIDSANCVVSASRLSAAHARGRRV